MNTNFILPGATKLNKSEMKSVKGGIPASEYCAGLQTIARGEYALKHWKEKDWDNWADAWGTHCVN